MLYSTKKDNKRLLPSYPIFVKDPYFSFWKNSEILNDGNLSFWFGQERKIFGVLKIDGVPYEFMGNYGALNKMKQVSVAVTSYTTDYIFTVLDVKLKVSFVSPLPLDDMKTLSCPVCYVNYDILSKSEHNYEFAVFAEETVCYNVDKRCLSEKGVAGGVFDLGDFQTAWFGLIRQAPLSMAEDNISSDWGYWYVAGEKAYLTNVKGIKQFLDNEEITVIPETPTKNYFEDYILAYNTAKSGKIMFAFDDVASIRYFGKYLYNYYFEDGKNIVDALKETFANSKKIDKHLRDIDKNLVKKASVYGEKYVNIVYASLRQAIAMHKLVKDPKGNVLFLSREANSNSCIGTVDVSYPSMPLFLMYDTEYVKGMMRPIFDFARMPVWVYDFAPHDVGTYPNCDGQVYGLNKEVNRFHGNYNAWRFGQFRTRPITYLYPSNFDAYEFKMQMPVEECANMIIMAEACYAYDKKSDFLKENMDLLEKWVVYLEKYGLIPANQLCTDDFAGHLDKNINLAIKATVGIACYANICKTLGRDEESEKYRAIAEDFAKQIEEFASKFKWCPITWDTDDTTYSLKYNLAFDKILKLNLFSKSFYDREMDAYMQKMNKYGIPLDNRKDYAKSDWLMWTASLTDDKEKQSAIIASLDAYLKETTTRVPFGDWYATETGKYYCFIARTVQGGNFILMLNENN